MHRIVERKYRRDLKLAPRGVRHTIVAQCSRPRVANLYDRRSTREARIGITLSAFWAAIPPESSKMKSPDIQSKGSCRPCTGVSWPLTRYPYSHPALVRKAQLQQDPSSMSTVRQACHVACVEPTSSPPIASAARPKQRSTTIPKNGHPK